MMIWSIEQLKLSGVKCGFNFWTLHAGAEVGEDPNRYVGTIRRWDSERGFGFIVQPQAEEETGEEEHKDRLGVTAEPW